MEIHGLVRTIMCYVCCFFLRGGFWARSPAQKKKKEKQCVLFFCLALGPGAGRVHPSQPAHQTSHLTNRPACETSAPYLKVCTHPVYIYEYICICTLIQNGYIVSKWVFPGMERIGNILTQQMKIGYVYVRMESQLRFYKLVLARTPLSHGP